MPYDVKNFLSLMKEKREEFGYSYQDLSDITGISAATLYRYETGATSIPLDKFYVIFRALKVDSRKLFDIFHEAGHSVIPLTQEGISEKQTEVKTAARNQKMINKFDKLSDKKKKIVENLIDSYFDEEMEDEE